MENKEEIKKEQLEENAQVKKSNEEIKSSKRKMAEENIKKVKNEASKFKKFIYRGNVVDMAVGVIVGGAFSTIVSSLVQDIITPLIGVVIGGLDFSNLTLQIGQAKIQYGSFIQSVIDFLIISICIFTVIQLFEKILHKDKKEEKQAPPKKTDEVMLLEEIRDLLKEKKNDEAIMK